MRMKSVGYRVCLMAWCLLLLVRVFVKPAGNWGHALVVCALLATAGMVWFLYVERRKASRVS